MTIDIDPVAFAVGGCGCRSDGVRSRPRLRASRRAFRRPVSTGILLDAILAAADMALSSIIVVSNALRLRRFRVPRLAAAPLAGRPALPRPP